MSEPIGNAFPKTSEALARAIREAAIDYPSFEQKLSPCDLEKCRATCCHDGAYMSREEAGVLLEIVDQHRTNFEAYEIDLPATPIHPAGRSWKTATREAEPHELADDYPEHFPQTRCVFLDSAHRCTLQRLSVDLQMPAWHYKPITCWMHPLNLSMGKPGDRPVLRIHSPETDPQVSPGYPGFAPCTHCGRPDSAGIPAAQALAPELAELEKLAGRQLRREIDD